MSYLPGFFLQGKTVITSIYSYVKLLKLRMCLYVAFSQPHLIDRVMKFVE